MKLPLLAGAAFMVAQVAAQSGGFLSQDKITELLLAGIAAMAVYIARETNRHSITLFGARDNDKDSGMVGDLKDIKKWQGDMQQRLDRGELLLIERDEDNHSRRRKL